MPATTRTEIEKLFGLGASGDPLVLNRVASFEDAGADAIVFADNPDAMGRALASRAGLILAPLAASGEGDARILRLTHPKYAFALVGRLLEGAAIGHIHATAIVDPGSLVGPRTSVGAGSVIEQGVVVGADCVIGNNVTIQSRTTLGDRCVVQAGAVLGSTGFGYVRGPDGGHVRFPQVGTLWIGDEVEIGANSTIDRGALGETRIGRGTKIDKLVHIAHNCRIGENVIVAAQVGIAGSTEVGDGAMLGGQAGLGEHATIGPGVILGGQGGVLPGKQLIGTGEVFWGTPARPLREYLKDLARLRRR